jgi:hypothetical protein
MKYNLRAIRKLILEAYDEQELTVFCHNYFREVVERFGTGTGKSEKAFQLVTYCDRREQLGVLVDRIKAERPEKYEKYRKRLEGGEEAPSVLEEIQAETSEYAEVLKAVSRVESHRKPAASKTSAVQETDVSKGYEEEGDLKGIALKPGVSSSDVYSVYEIGMRQLLHRLGQNHSLHLEVLVYHQRLFENVTQSRRHGDTDARKAERSEIINRLNQIALSTLGISFSELCGLI